MAVQSKPIPALYVVYILRSTTRHASLYIGSTPNPPRRLNQHNGKAKGGAVRTSRPSLRPWEMVGVVSGFPSMVGALKFEWALNNPHVSLHIAPEERLSISTQRRRNGHPKRPPHSLTSILSNVHLLLRVPSFARWPLKLHFFDKDVHARWGRHCASAAVEPLRQTLEVVTDFEPAADDSHTTTKANILEDTLSEDDEEAASDAGDEAGGGKAAGGPKRGIHALPLDHAPLAAYLEKGQNITTFEQEGGCVVCHEHLDHDRGLYAICSNGECPGVGHVDCWSRHLLRQGGEEGDDAVILPMEGRCPKCEGAVRWSDMMRELTLRVRGQKEVDQVLRKSRRAAGVTKGKVKAKAKAKAKAKTKTPAETPVETPAESPAKSPAKRPAKSIAKSKGRGRGKAKVTSTSEDDIS